MDNIKEVLDKLGITDYPNNIDDKCTVYLKDSDIYEAVFERLEKLDGLTQDDVQVTEDENLVTYYNENVYIELRAIFDEDLYTLTVSNTNYEYEKEGEE